MLQNAAEGSPKSRVRRWEGWHEAGEGHRELSSENPRHLRRSLKEAWSVRCQCPEGLTQRAVRLQRLQRFTGTLGTESHWRPLEEVCMEHVSSRKELPSLAWCRFFSWGGSIWRPGTPPWQVCKHKRGPAPWDLAPPIHAGLLGHLPSIPAWMETPPQPRKTPFSPPFRTTSFP